MKHFEYVVIGAGPAGGAAAIELARDSTSPTVALIGGERHAPYERPPLSKATLKEQGGVIAPQHLYGDVPDLSRAGVTPFIPDLVVGIHRENHCVTLASGEQLSYGKLLFATGSSPRRLSVPGASLPRIHYLRTYDDAVALSAEIRAQHKIVVIGGGFIGLEVAATARSAGCEVVVIEAGPRLLARAVPDAISSAVLRKFEGEQVKVVLGEGVQAIFGSECAKGVELTNGARIYADCIVVGIGAAPNSALAESCGLDVRDGILTDADGRTSDSCCFAAGDVAHRTQGLATHPKYARRLEAWQPAIEQGVAVARVMLGVPSVPLATPWIWSDQFDWNIQIAGHGDLADTVIYRQGTSDDSTSVFQLCQGRLIGMVTLNEPRTMSLGRRALERGAIVDPAQLANPEISIKDALLGVRSPGTESG
ncbi:NAD(P)/FAD-dependent oxidoreductase [Burkholderia cepacia]|uniref:NAD(P)/FAD-dependent oxidoreductase n=1 Tax=Burkholderia cepacia TaxID=292 RepID=UPI002AB71702|nr:FAD-dependent oxidoreductase [Burkholderia cepacia]